MSSLLVGSALRVCFALSPQDGGADRNLPIRPSHLQQRLQSSETVAVMRGAIDSLRAFGAVFGNPNLRRLQLAGIGSTLGSWAYTVGLAVYVYDQGGARAVGLVYFARWG